MELMVDSPFVIALLVVVGLSAGAGVWWFMTAGGRRAKGMQQAATRLGFTFQGTLSDSPRERFAPFRLFGLEPAGTMDHTMVRSHPPLWVFDFEYVIPRDQTVKQTVAVFEAPLAKWPALVIESRRRERFTVALGRMLTRKVTDWAHRYKEIDWPGHPAFAEQYRLLSTEPGNAVIPVLRDALIDRLAASPGWEFEARDRWVLIYRRGKRIAPEQLHDHVQRVQRLFDAFSR